MENKKLKILILVEDYLPIFGGVTSVVYRSMMALKDKMDITIGAVEAKKVKGKKFVDEQNGIKVIRCKGYYNPISTNRESLMFFDKNFKKEIEKENYDLIHCHFALDFLKYAKKLGKKQNIPVIATAHSILFEDVKNAVKSKNLAKFITELVVSRLNSANIVWTVSNFAKNYLSNFGLRKDALVVPNAVQTPGKFEHVDIFSKYNIPKNKFLLFSISRLVKMKNIDLVLKSLSLIKQDFVFVVAGGGQDATRLKNLAKKLKLQDKVLFVGKIPQDDLYSFYEKVNMITFTSIGDSSGLTQYEAAFFEKPTLAVENTAISENLKDCNGFVCKNTPEDCAKKLEFCMQNPQIVVEVGKNAKKTLFRSYDQPKVVNELLGHYENAVKTFHEKQEQDKTLNEFVKHLNKKF